MRIDNDREWVVLETVEHTIAVMRVDIDVGDALQAKVLTGMFDRDTAIIEHTETRRAIAPCVMQSADRIEGALGVTRQDLFERPERSTDDCGRGLEDAGPGGRIAMV